jgi:hypothetical protein
MTLFCSGPRQSASSKQKKAPFSISGEADAFVGEKTEIHAVVQYRLQILEKFSRVSACCQARIKDPEPIPDIS